MIRDVNNVSSTASPIAQKYYHNMIYMIDQTGKINEQYLLQYHSQEKILTTMNTEAKGYKVEQTKRLYYSALSVAGQKSKQNQQSNLLFVAPTVNQ